VGFCGDGDELWLFHKRQFLEVTYLATVHKKSSLTKLLG
jgi:hypothetical protein